MNEGGLSEKLSQALKGATPSLQLSVWQKGRKSFEFQYGDEYLYYDWASLTKIVFTTSVLMQWVDSGFLRVNDMVVQYLKWFPYQDIRISHLLSHSAGFRRWSPFYNELDLSLDFNGRWMQLQNLVREDPRQWPIDHAEYSDLDFLYLGFMMEAMSQRPLYQVWQQANEKMQLPQAHFCRDNQPHFERKLYAPTEDCPWRKKTLQGEVHDDNTWTVGGVSSHAGLFGRLTDLELWALSLRKAILGKGRSWVSHPTAKLFAKRAVPASLGDWSLGFMMPSLGKSSGGKYFGPSAIGHTGFTGTSFWFDPHQDLMVLILSNRVHPTRENKSFVDLRPQIHNWIIEASYS